MMSEDTKKTCLHSRHVALGAKMSPFAGFDMPISYESITVEHQAVRERAGMFDVSHMGEIFVEGPEAEAFVNYVFTNEVRGLAPGKILYGMMCYPEGGVVDDLLVYREFAPQKFLLVVNAANIDKDDAWLHAQVQRNPDTGKAFDCTVRNESQDWGQIAVQGPEAEKVIAETLGLGRAAALGFYEFCEEVWQGKRVIVSRTGYTGEDGFELYTTCEGACRLWDALAGAGVQPCGLGCRDTLRFEAGLPLYGDELSEEISPIMAGFGMFCKLDKDFIGRDALARQKAEGAPRKLVGIELQDNAVPRAGYPVETLDGVQAGTVTTGYHSISLDKSLCFALVDSRYAALGAPLQVRIRKKVFPGVVVKKRFYQPHYKK